MTAALSTSETTFAADRRRQHRETAKKRTLYLILTTTLGTIAALVLLVFGIGGTLSDLIALGVMYLLSMIGVELGYHRYFTHKSYKANPYFAKLLAILGAFSLQGPLFWWCGIHRHHHGQTDTNLDPHSPYRAIRTRSLKGFMHSHTGWLFCDESIDPDKWHNVVKDLYRDRDLFKIHMKYWHWAIAGIVLPGIISGIINLSWESMITGVLWGGFVRAFICHHSFWALNSICHMYGKKEFDTGDKSTNFWLVAFLTLGQGWHNNHHAFPYSAKVGLLRGQLDIGWIILRILGHIGVISDLRCPSIETIENKKIK